MDTSSDIKLGWYDWQYIPNHPVPSQRAGEAGKIISSAAAARHLLHYIQYRPEALEQDERDAPSYPLPRQESGPLVGPEMGINDKLNYEQYRPEMDENGNRIFPHRPMLMYGWAGDADGLIDQLKACASPFVLTYHLVASIHPRLAVILQQHQIDLQTFTADYATAFIHDLYERFGWGSDVEMALVFHMGRTADNLPHPHAHITLPGTGYDAATDQRIPIPFITPEILQAGQSIADRTAEQEMDRVLTRAWRLEIPEMIPTFYDPLDLPVPEHSLELDTWFPRPKIPAAALEPAPDLAQTLFPAGIWEAATGFGDSDELVHLVDALFTDLSFEIPPTLAMATTMFGPESTPFEPDEGDANSLATALNTPPERIMDEREGESHRTDQAENSAPSDVEIAPAGIARTHLDRPDTGALPARDEPDESESLEATIHNPWPQSLHPEATNRDGEADEIAALIDSLFPASFWETADGFGDEDIAQQVAELFGNYDLDQPLVASPSDLLFDWAAVISEGDERNPERLARPVNEAISIHDPDVAAGTEPAQTAELEPLWDTQPSEAANALPQDLQPGGDAAEIAEWLAEIFSENAESLRRFNPPLAPETSRTESDPAEADPDAFTANLDWHMPTYDAPYQLALVAHWDDKRGRGRIIAHVEWVDAEADEAAPTGQFPVYQTSMTDYLFDYPDSIDRYQAVLNTHDVFDDRFNQFNHALSQDFDLGLIQLHQAWFETQPEATVRQGFLPGVPRALLSFDETSQQKGLERLPGIGWVRDDASASELGLTLDLDNPDENGGYYLQSLQRWTDARGIQQVEVVARDTNPETLDSGLKVLWEMDQELATDFAENAEIARQTWNDWFALDEVVNSAEMTDGGEDKIDEPDRDEEMGDEENEGEIGEDEEDLDLDEDWDWDPE